MISIIIPFYNERENLPILLKELEKAVAKIKEPCEAIFVDDGSKDKPKLLLKSTVFKIKLLTHKKKEGKGRALSDGVNQAEGEIIIFIDADLQDDPADLPKFLEKIDQGYDFVNGIRSQRKDSRLVKIYSWMARYFLKIFVNSPYQDINCGFKAFRKEVLKDFIFYGNNFRFLPLWAYYNGYKVTEIPVNNRPRIYGQSKFGKKKFFTGFLDTLTAYFLYRFSEKPLHFFGTIGFILFITGLLIDLYLAYERIFFNVLLYRRPLLWLGVLLIIVGIQIIMTGIIGELIVFLNKKK
ncbi:MAG: glycosyltransferase family 2 protein [Microgenomates group bacterium]|nr:glycosyltransferase family 2 protein [Microgenomates group bacterium]